MIAASRQLVEEPRHHPAPARSRRVRRVDRAARGRRRRCRALAAPGATTGCAPCGLGIDAAQAAALLGRALLAQGRAAEAEALSHESELLAGDDLKAAIAWRGVRAEALARRGEHGAAIAFARAAVGDRSGDRRAPRSTPTRVWPSPLRSRAAGSGAEADAEEAQRHRPLGGEGGDVARRTGAPRRRAPRSGVPVRPRIARSRRGLPCVAGFARTLRPSIPRASDAAMAARDMDALPGLVTDDYEGIHHPTGLTYELAGALARMRELLQDPDVTFAQEPLAMLGDALALFRTVGSGSAASLQGFDVGPYEIHTLMLAEVGTQGRRRRTETFADDHLGDAVARLYQRHAELLPDGPARTRATATARSVAARMAPFDLERLATTFAADIEVVDHRTVGFGTLRGAERLRHALRAFLDLIDAFAWRAVDVLALEADAFLLRYVGSGTEARRRLGLPAHAARADGLRRRRLVPPVGSASTSSTRRRRSRASTRSWERSRRATRPPRASERRDRQ